MLSQRLLLLGVVLSFGMAQLSVLQKLATLPLPYPAINERVQTLQSGLELVQPSAVEDVFSATLQLDAVARRLYGVTGCETVAAAPDGSITLIDAWNNAYTATPDPEGSSGSAPDSDSTHVLHGWTVRPHPKIAHLGAGRTLGVMHDAEGNLLFADAVKGLCFVNLSSPIPTPIILASHLAPLPSPSAASPRFPFVNFADDVDVAPNGTIFFSDASSIRPLGYDEHGAIDAMGPSFLEAMRGQPSGRLLAYHPSTGNVNVAVQGIWFANGVAVSPDGSFVAVCETFGLRVLRYWLTGERAGEVDTLIDSLPGYPDSISVSSDGNFWLPLVLPYQKVQTLGTYSPIIRWMLSWVPKSLKPKYKGWGYVMKVSPQGQVLGVMMDKSGEVVSGVTSVTEAAGKLWLGNLDHNWVGVVDLGEVDF